MPKYGPKFTAKILVSTTPQQKEKWQKYCDLNGISMAQAIRMCMNTVLREEQSISYEFLVDKETK